MTPFNFLVLAFSLLYIVPSGLEEVLVIVAETRGRNPPMLGSGEQERPALASPPRDRPFAGFFILRDRIVGAMLAPLTPTSPLLDVSFVKGVMTGTFLVVVWERCSRPRPALSRPVVPKEVPLKSA